MKPKPINQLAIWLPMKTEGLSIKAMPPSYPYIENGQARRSDLKNPVARYAKNYEAGKNKFSLCLITNELDSKKIEAWMNKQSKEIKASQIQDQFILLDVHYGK